jgi:pimeloyl-ACP methyl ester carboxylesterase
MSSRLRTLLLLGGAAAAVGGAAAWRRATANAHPPTEEELASLGWGEIEALTAETVATPDGASLAVWDVGEGPTVVLPHCWGCSHAIWVPVARRLAESGHRVVLYDQRGHGESTRGTSPLTIELLGEDMATVLAARDVSDAVLVGHSMGGMTIMSLATYRPEVLVARGRAIVLVATAAANMGGGPVQAQQFAAALMASPTVSRVLRSSNGHRFVRGTFGTEAIKAQVDLTRNLFADCDPPVRAGYLTAMSGMNLLEGIATIGVPTTVMVGSRDRLTPPARARQMVAAIPGSRLVTLEGRGHMLPLEDPDAVTDEIIRAVKG